VNLGILPGYGGTQRLVQLIGKSKAMELMLTAELIDARKAYELGLVNHLVDDGEEINASRALIEKIATKAPLAVAEVIDSVNAYFDHTRDGFEKEISAFSKLALTEDFKEGASAFIEKRSPIFKST
jgi:enoyl-CoA hydratase